MTPSQGIGWRLHVFSAQVSEMGAMIGSVETGVQTLYDGLGIVFMLGGAVVAYRNLQGRIGKQERELVDYKLYVPDNEGILGRVEALKFLTRFATSPVASISVSPRGRCPLAEGL